MSERISVTLDYDALSHNIDIVRRHAPNSRILAVVKANAYGHGADRVVRHIGQSVDACAVATVPEAIGLRKSGYHGRLWVLSDVCPWTDIESIVANSLCPVVHQHAQLDAVCRQSRPLKEVVVKIDTGMGRIGFEPEELPEVIRKLENSRTGVIRVMSHLANADNPDDPHTERQIERFKSACNGLGLEMSLANSAGILAFPDSCLDWVRPGLMLYGVSPLAGVTGSSLGLRPVMTLSARLLAIRRFSKGQPVGYGGTWVCPKDTTAAIVACGYGDGYPRHADNGTPVLLPQGIAPLIGRVSMDSIAVDITELDGVSLADRAILWGAGLPAEIVANHSGTIAYELLCRLTSRVGG